MNHLLNSFANLFCIGRAMIYPKFESIDTMEQLTEVRSDIGVQFVLFNSWCARRYRRAVAAWSNRVCLPGSMQSARQSMELLRQMQQLVGETERITDMVDLLEEVDAQKERDLRDNVVPGDCIAFENCTIVTPKDVTLVKNLTFKVEVGSSLLLTGHNGSGKSSIFRCLAGMPQAGTPPDRHVPGSENCCLAGHSINSTYAIDI
jgi:ABC-type multidrug transport system fused ATPase/permease subunit